MSQNYKNLITTPEDINILLVGEKGVGKSTFAHAFANYIKYGQFRAAEKGKVSYLPRYSLNGNLYAQQKDDNNADALPTGTAHSYVFSLPKYGRRIHLIDTPGFGDVFQDVNKIESILTYTSQIDCLHAICFVMKPRNLRETVVLRYCVKFLLSRLEKSAGKNVIFLFTHAWSSCYGPELADIVFKGIPEQCKSSPSQTDVKCGKENVFCLDNEVFCFLISGKTAAGESDKEAYSEIWGQSVAEGWRMIDYILGKADSSEEITPHEIENTIALHNAKKIISRASRFFIDIEDIIEHLEKHDFLLTEDMLNRHLLNLGQLYCSWALNYVQEPCSAGRHCDTFKFTGNFNKIQEVTARFKHEKSAYEKDKQMIESCLRNMAAFVKLSAILPCNDSHEAYIRYLISQKIRQATENDINLQTIINYHDLIKQHAEEIRITNDDTDVDALPKITTAEIMEGMVKLKTLKETKENFETLHQEVITIRTNLLG